VAAAASIIKDVPAAGWIVGGVLVAGAGFVVFRTLKSITGAIPGAIGDLAGGAADLAGKAADEFSDLGTSAASAAKDVAGDAAEEVEDLGRFLGAVGAEADKKVSTAVDNVISDVKTSAVVVKANRTRRNIVKGRNKVAKKAKTGLKRFGRRLRRRRR
jgi:hypothetical protein